MTFSHIPEWADLEREVGSLYRALGYSVKRDELLRHNQIDLVATKSLGGAKELRLAIEVKYRSQGALPLDEVRSFLDVGRHLLSTGQITAAVLVVNTSFSRNAKAMVEEDQRFHLATLEDLRRDIVFNEEHLQRWLSTYATSQISSRFIDVGLRPAGRTAGSAVQSITELVDSFDKTLRPNSIVLMADYGGGKSTGLERVKFLALSRYLATSEGRLPILFPLKYLGTFVDLDAYVGYVLRQELGAQCDISTFWSLAEQDRLLLLLDGFDEIAVQPTARERAGFIRRLAPLFFGPSASILTTRPSYFASNQEYTKFLRQADNARGLATERTNPARGILGPQSTKLLTDLRQGRARGRGDSAPAEWSCDTHILQPLDTTQVREYIRRLEGDFSRIGIHNPEDVLRFLDEVYDLSDLVTRPILLQMIVETILSGTINVYKPTESISPAELYEVYSELRLADDFDKGPVRQKGLTTVQRRRYAEFCARRMQILGRLELSRAEAEALADQVTDFRPLTSPASHRTAVDRIMTDLRTCSFLTVDEDGNMRFIHKSFYEFFLASRVREALVGGTSLDDLNRPLPQEILYFIGAMSISIDSPGAIAVYGAIMSYLTETNRLQDAGTSRESQIRQNLLGALFYGRETQSEIVLDGGTVAPVERRALNLERVTFSNLRFADLRLANLTLRDCVVSKCILGGHVGVLEATNCQLEVTCDRVNDLLVDQTGGLLDLRQYPRRVQVINGSSVELSSRESSPSLTLTAANSQVTAGPRGDFNVDLEVAVFEFQVGSLPSGTRGKIAARTSLIVLVPDGLAGSPESSFIADEGGSYEGSLSNSIVVIHPWIPQNVVAKIVLTRSVILGGYVSEDPSLRGSPQRADVTPPERLLSVVRRKAPVVPARPGDAKKKRRPADRLWLVSPESTLPARGARASLGNEALASYTTSIRALTRLQPTDLSLEAITSPFSMLIDGFHGSGPGAGRFRSALLATLGSAAAVLIENIRRPPH